MKELEILKRPLFWLSLLFVLLWSFIFSLPDNKLHLVFCDVGQGDAILISYHQTQILIDGGPDKKVLNCLSKHLPFWDRQIEMVILTHPEQDHFGGLIDVFERYSVRYFVSNGLRKSSASFTELEQFRKDKKVLPLTVKAGDKIKISSLQFLFLWPEKDHLKNDNLNDSSVVLKLVYGDFEALLPGDISEKVEKLLDLSAGGVEVLKVAHHGSRFSTSKEFLEKVRPILAVISVGKNSFGHPTEEVIKKLRDLEIEILRTDKEGEIEVISDGRKWGVVREDMIR